MKRLFLLTVTLCCAILASAQERGALEDFSGKLSSGTVSFQYTFEVKGDVPMKGNGVAAMRGPCYHIAGNGMEIWCDARTRWIVDRSAKEAYIETVDAAVTDYLSNPATLLISLNEAFETVADKEVTLSGKKCRKVSMTPVIPDTGLQSVSLYLDGSVPARVEITVEDGTVTLFKIADFAVNEKSDVPFTFDIASLSPDYVVTDLR